MYYVGNENTLLARSHKDQLMRSNSLLSMTFVMLRLVLTFGPIIVLVRKSIRAFEVSLLQTLPAVGRAAAHITQ